MRAAPIFLSYRRDDSIGITGRIRDRLAARHGRAAVFMDVDSLTAGVDFRAATQTRIAATKVVLAVIGGRWLGAGRERRRIDDPDDPVRIEIEAALTAGVALIPVYVGETPVLTRAALPASLAALADRNARFVDPGADFEHHIATLQRDVDAVLLRGPLARARRGLAHQLGSRPISALIVLAIAVAAAWFRSPIAAALTDASGVREALTAIDTAIFRDDPLGRYEIARGLPDREALVAETDLVAAIRATRETLDIFALTGTAFFTSPEALQRALQSGARVRVLLFDHSDANAIDRDRHFELRGGVESMRLSASNAAQARGALRNIRRLAQVDADRLSIKWWRGPFLNSFWIRDGRHPSHALAHLEVSFYGDGSTNPSVRFGTLGPRMTAAFQRQFDFMWAAAHDDG